MNFKIDENLPIEVAELLKQAEYDAVTVSEQNLTGTSDSNLAALCRKEKRTIVTLDTDFADIMTYPPFADIRTYPPDAFFGVIVMRLNQQDKLHVLAVFRRVMQLFPTEPIERRLWLVEENRIRIRS